MLVLRNRVLRLGNVYMWVVLPFYVVDLLMFRNCVLKLKNVKIRAVPYRKGFICGLSGMVFLDYVTL